MVVVQSYLTKNDCYKESRTIKVKGLILNSIGCPQPSAKVLCNNWNRPGKQICAHAFIDANDGKVYQTLPWNARGASCNGSANDTHISVIMCESPFIRYTSPDHFSVIGDKEKVIETVSRTYKTAIELFGQLCIKYHLDPAASILSRKEAFEKGIANKSGTPETLWKSLGLTYTMDGFRKDVSIEMRKIQDSTENYKATGANKEEIKVSEVVEAKQEEVKNEIATMTKVRIDVDNLRIRSGPGTNCAVTGKYTGKGVFEISEIQNGSGATKGWGKLSDGSGWIMLDYVTILS